MRAQRRRMFEPPSAVCFAASHRVANLSNRLCPGAPKLNNLNVRGSQFVKVNVEIPKSLSSKERELVMAIKETGR